MQVSVCLGAILIPEYLDSILAILLLGAEEQNSRNIFRNTFLFRNIPNERALSILKLSLYHIIVLIQILLNLFT